MILKTLVLSKIVNICSVINIPDSFMEEVDALLVFFNFYGEKVKGPKSKNK